MSVFTSVNTQQLQAWLQDYAIGELVALEGISAGITNTNYFVTIKNHGNNISKYVLTLFEQNSIEDLPYFIALMSHLAACGIPCPRPIADKKGNCLHMLNSKPAALVSCLVGKDIENPSIAQCSEVGGVLANMHLVGESFERQFPQYNSRNQRGADWRIKTAALVMPNLSMDEQQLLQATMTFQSTFDTSKLPAGVIHADLFRDNVLFEGNKVGGIIDFYYACHGVLAYDLAIAVNDWCVKTDGSLDEPRLNAMLAAYQAVRLLSEAERSAWAGLLCIAALRFWLSRLHDQIFPHEGELTHAKDPNHFKNILQHRIKLQLK